MCAYLLLGFVPVSSVEKDDGLLIFGLELINGIGRGAQMRGMASDTA